MPSRTVFISFPTKYNPLGIMSGCRPREWWLIVKTCYTCHSLLKLQGSYRLTFPSSPPVKKRRKAISIHLWHAMLPGTSYGRPDTPDPKPNLRLNLLGLKKDINWGDEMRGLLIPLHSARTHINRRICFSFLRYLISDTYVKARVCNRSFTVLVFRTDCMAVFGPSIFVK